ncbi:endonuclease/exonuclease/phosphatase family protein [Cellulomonas sp.]|uniref:endonuclease/exonuclease/phosphatase family protein n=1 Tax=Cellulomonas sp. TaxID=40001 RepID=UPI0028126050|nr:endonuclease/exonuclease/phosphatase family protein [Cellulomonas sp.]
MRVATWNVWWRFGEAWPARERAIRSVLADLRPDVLGLQETWRDADGSQAEALAALLGGHAVFVPVGVPPLPDPPEHPVQAGAEIGIGLVSRWPVLATAVHDLPAHVHEPARALHATLDHPAGPLHVLVACTEWEPTREATADHRAQTRVLADLLADPALDGELPVLLVGDLNAAPGTPELAPLEAVAEDLWLLGGGDPDAVTLSSDTPMAPVEAVKQIDRRIDHVLVRRGRPAAPPLRVTHAALAGQEPVEGVLPSDHRAVVCDVELPAP